jgi:hypothetical protein
VERIIHSGGSFSQQDMESIVMFGDALHDLIVYDCVENQHSDVVQEGKVSRDLVALLKLCLRVARASLRSTSRVESGQSVTQPFDRRLHYRNDFEEFIRTGVYAPSHPVIRTFPYFRQDYLAHMDSSRRRKAGQEQKCEAAEILRKQSERMGQTCNKYKTRQRALTPGLFTVFCGGCGVCEAFEMMPIAE